MTTGSQITFLMNGLQGLSFIGGGQVINSDRLR